MELFERVAYYGQATILSVFLRDHMKFDEVTAGTLSSTFGGLIYFLPIFAGALADKFGFRKSFSIAFSVLAIGYFLIGSTGMTAFNSIYSDVDKFWLLMLILIFTAIGGSFIKPSVLGTIALTSSEETKSLGYAIYYWLVNIGAALGPAIAFLVRDKFGIEFVYVVSAASCLLMFISTQIFYREPEKKLAEKAPSLVQIIKNLLLVLRNLRFMIFLLIFSLFWIMFWQIFVIVPYFIVDHIDKNAPFEIIESMGAWSIIFLQLIVNRLTKNIPTIQAIISGFFFSSFSWIVMLIYPSIPTFIAGIVVFSIGEMTQAPRYYEYIADLAPKGQEALFQGFAFLPISIGWLVGGTFGGWLYKTFGKVDETHSTLFLILFGIGMIATALMYLYHLWVKRSLKNV
ncbi:MAG: MFS transporter [Ignavibacteria bacterium]|nr:MFS transporter [Ignavibacteria bacterium]